MSTGIGSRETEMGVVAAVQGGMWAQAAARAVGSQGSGCSCRVPKRPIINTPVVSISVHDNDEPVQRALEKPITVQFRLLETEERTKPICVFWNHSIL